MIPETRFFDIRLAANEADLLASQRLRYQVFVDELGGDGDLVDHDARLERDDFDTHVDHLILVDNRRDPAALDHVVGAYRLLTDTRASQIGRFYCDAEYDLGPLRASGRRLLELGRSCVHADYRGGTGMLLLWNALADYVQCHGVEVLFGVASFHGTDVAALVQPLGWLHHHHMAPPELRVTARAPSAPMDILPADRLDRRAALAAMPALIKAYLRLGGVVGQGAFIDRPFNTTDVCLLMDTHAMSARHRNFYTRRTESQDAN